MSKTKQPQPAPQVVKEETIPDLDAPSAKVEEVIANVDSSIPNVDSPAEAKQPSQPAPQVVKEENGKAVFKNGRFYGNRDKEQKYPLDYNPNGAIVARIADVRSQGGSVSEIPESVKIQVFETSIYEHLKKTNAFKGKAVLILHA